MATQNPNFSDLKRRLVAEIRRDKKRTIILAALLAVGGIMGVRLIVKHGLPGSASASVSSVEGSGILPPVEDQASDFGDSLPASADNDTRREQYLMSLDRNITRDLFTAHLDFFPRSSSKAVAADRAPAGPGWFTDVRKRVLAKQQAESEHLARLHAIRAQARELSLTSTILGGSPAAVINGQVVRKGQMIGGFRLESVGSDRCVLSRDGMRVDLMMEE